MACFLLSFPFFGKKRHAPTRIFSYSECMHYFGTDGIRNKADWLLANEIPYALGKTLARRGGKIIVARDVREHSLDLEKQLCKGLMEGATQIWVAGVLPTPALAYIAQLEKADYAVMITASHNAPEFNGLKVFGKSGKKLCEKDEIALDEELFATMNSPATPQPVFIDEACADTLTDEELTSPLSLSLAENHRIRIVDGAEFLYLKHVKSMFPRFDGMKVRLDCAYGCFATLAPKAFLDLGAIVCAEHNVRDGKKVNVNCGSTHVADFAKRVKKDEIGFAFDGDGDRVLAVADGKVYDGDAMLLALSMIYRLQGKLKKRFVVGTTLTNTKLARELAYHNTALIRADVGDKHVLDTLEKQGLLLGGEKSGHIVMLDKGTTGDGLVTALSLLEVKRTVGSLPKFTPYPMLELSVPADNPENEINSTAFQRKIAEINARFSKQGRLIVRKSGTEPVVRITYECFSSSPQPIFDEIRKIIAVN